MRRAEAKALKLPKYNTGKPCIRGHLSDRSTATGHCIQCRNDRMAAYLKTPHRQAWKSSYEATPEAKALKAARNARYYSKPDKVAATKAIKRQWNKDNLARGRMYAADRRARIEQATPPWVDKAEIMKIYVEADRITRETGIPHEVDHFYPLVGRNSCGLHVPWNLKIITMTANRRKSNKPPVVPDLSPSSP